MSKPPKCKNNDMYKFVNLHAPFYNNNETAFGVHDRHLYVVYSYGYHFPMYVYDSQARQWFGNSEKYSSTTTRHQGGARPTNVDVTYVDTAMLKRIIAASGYNKAIHGRIAA